MVGQQARRHLTRVDVDERRVEQPRDLERLGALRGIGDRVERRAEREDGLASARVQIDDDARAREDLRLDEVGDAIGERAARIAGERPVHVDAVFGRRARVRGSTPTRSAAASG